MLCMGEITSSEFRRRYATLKVPTSVTVLGRSIGVWVPATDGTTIQIDQHISPKQFGDKDIGDESTYRHSQRTVTITPGERFNTQPFTGPIPKKGK